MSDGQSPVSGSELTSDVLNSINERVDTSANWPPTFEGPIWTVLAFLVGFTVWVMISNMVFTRLFSGTGQLVESLWSIGSKLVLFSIVWLILRYEGVSLRELGLSRRLLAPALLAAGGVVVAVNLTVIALLISRGHELSFGLFEFYRTPPASYSLGTIAVLGISEYLFTGPVEEIALRGFLQNKLSALLGSSYQRLGTAIAILVASVSFALLHVPTIILVRNEPLAIGTLIILALTGVVFGAIYALTHNLYLVIILHGIGNFWPVVVDFPVGLWPNWGIILVFYGVLVALYRLGTDTSSGYPERGTAG
jgi:membrane protease YdiL (CAAX protease family)